MEFLLSKWPWYVAVLIRHNLHHSSFIMHFTPVSYTPTLSGILTHYLFHHYGVTTTLPATATSYTVSELTPYSKHLFKVSACTSAVGFTVLHTCTLLQFYSASLKFVFQSQRMYKCKACVIPFLISTICFCSNSLFFMQKPHAHAHFFV